MERLESEPFEVAGGGPSLSGERLGEGPPVVLAHGAVKKLLKNSNG